MRKVLKTHLPRSAKPPVHLGPIRRVLDQRLLVGIDSLGRMKTKSLK